MNLEISIGIKDWRNFEKVINKVVLFAKNSDNIDEDWAVEVNKPIKIFLIATTLSSQSEKLKKDH